MQKQRLRLFWGSLSAPQSSFSPWALTQSGETEITERETRGREINMQGEGEGARLERRGHATSL